MDRVPRGAVTAPVAEHDVWVLRHGATEWSVDGRHTGRTDLPLTEDGRDQARVRRAGPRRRPFARVLVSPLAAGPRDLRAGRLRRPGRAHRRPARVGLRRLRGPHDAADPRDGAGLDGVDRALSRGETLDQVAARVDRVIAEVRATDGPVALFAHGHVLRVLTARWCELEPIEGRRFPLDTGTVSILGYEHGFAGVRRWNSTA